MTELPGIHTAVRIIRLKPKSVNDETILIDSIRDSEKQSFWQGCFLVCYIYQLGKIMSSANEGSASNLILAICVAIGMGIFMLLSRDKRISYIYKVKK